MNQIDFNFPFPPYEVQQNFMIALYNILENKETGILESPTGTGKTLSLLCGSLKWLSDFEMNKKQNLELNISKFENDIKIQEKELENAKDWISLQYKVTEIKKVLIEEKNKLKLNVEFDKFMDDLRTEQVFRKKKRQFQKRNIPTNNSDKLLNEVNSPVENDEKTEDDEQTVFDLKEIILDDNDEDIEDDNQPKYNGVQIFYASRTHSQLNQVLHEIKKTIYSKNLRVISLASRQNSCLNSHVKNLNSNELINEKCIDLQKLKTTKKIVLNPKTTNKKLKLQVDDAQAGKCQFYNKENFLDMKNELLCEISDIEDIMKLGNEMKGCPYYSSKLGIADAQLILLPYQMLLNQKIRQQFQINLNGNVVIIDEAHNLLDTLSDMHSSIINMNQLEKCYIQLNNYVAKYTNRMRSKNLVQFNKLIFIVKRLINFFKFNNFNTQKYRMLSIVDLMSEGEFPNMNISEILRFCDETRLAEKVHGFAKWFQIKQTQLENESNLNIEKESSLSVLLKNLQQNTNKKLVKINKKKENLKKNVVETVNEVKQASAVITVSSVIRPVLRFLECLTDKPDAGGVLVNYDEKDKTKCYMKYILLNPNEHFAEILSNCRSVVLAGGTMQPTSEIINMLLNDKKDDVKQHFFDHVVSQEACLPLVIKKGPRGEQFLFNYNNRCNPKLFAELGSILVNVSSLIPHGIVCFFVSYDYLNQFYSYLEKNNEILQQIEKKKKIFIEPKNREHVEKVLRKYRIANEITGTGGGILFSVVGGKLSEGLNFSDNLGRCVIVVGMPYPNKSSPELLEKMKKYNKDFGENAGNIYYENLCMKAVNQSIGRAVRHVNDYASILLLDERYGREDILKKLPKWIRNSLKIPSSYGQGQMYLAHFFSKKKKLTH